jgi:hypothetical protein
VFVIYNLTYLAWSKSPTNSACGIIGA